MKRLYTFILIFIVFQSILPCPSIAYEDMDSVSLVMLDQDSVPGIMSLSDDGEGKASLFNGIIPPAPQSQALARYAEYPVSHTTGIPDISIPLYEIHVGNYTLPISVSYHSSGARVDDVPTCVGQGWTLNAGGAVIRTVMGAPDQPQGLDQDRKYMDVEAVRKLVSEKKGDGTHGYRHILRLLLENNKCYDTESDRFSYNVGGMTGLFRYDVRKKTFVTLDHAPLEVSFLSGSPYSRFILKDGSGNEFELGKNEISCLSDYGNGNEYTTAWYVDKVKTPYGDIGFSYLPGDLAFNTTRTSMTTEAGYYPYKNGDYGGVDNFGYKIEERDASAVYRHDQTLVEEITWEGNRICFSYSNNDLGFGPHRLESMTVYNPDGSVRKKVTFSYTIWYESGSSGSGRPLLTSIDDSEAGKFLFTYYDTGSYYGIPSWRRTTDTAGFSDLWGYYNGGNASKWFLPSDIAVQLEDKLHGISTGSRDRTPKLSYARMGTLKTVQYPTGGSVTYTYELNSTVYDGKQYTAGGLRVSGVEVKDGNSVYSKTYSYNGSLTQDPPEQRMICGMTLVWTGVDPYPAISYATSWRTVSSYPVGYSYAPSNPVAYTSITETRSDGSRTEYEYYPGQLVDAAVARPTPHPSTWSPSLTDPGCRQPRLKRKSVFDSNGTEVYRESMEYAASVADNSVTTGVRLYSNISWTDYKCRDRSFSEKENDSMDEWVRIAGVSLPLDIDDFLFIEETNARRIPTLPSRRTEEYLATGFKTVTEYSYDGDFRTLQPRYMTVTNSDGIVCRTEFTYPFNHTDAACTEMSGFGLNDLPVETRIYSATSLLSKERTDYRKCNGYFYPEKMSSWSLPTGTNPSNATVTLVEREKVSSYNAKGRPLSITVNGTDVTSLKWDSTGTLLESVTAPGGLATTYTHKRLFGIASVKQPNGYTTNYSYNGAGLLASVSDGNGAIETYTYSVANHSQSIMTGAGNSVTTKRFLNVVGPKTVDSRQYLDGLGRPSTAVQGGANTKGTYLYTAVSYDALGRESQSVLPSVGGTDISSKTPAQVKSLSNTTYSDQYAWSETTYDALDRPVKVTTPGNAWHSAGKARTTQYISNASNSVRLYRAPLSEITLDEDGYYAENTLQGVRTVDEDGNEMTVFTDRLGRKVLERRGPESQKGQNDTYFVYNALGQLRYVLSPGYELSGYKEKFAYEYRYDEHGNVVKKFIPGAGYTQYWYDRAGRLAFMQDPNLRERKLHRFFVYDRAGRIAVQGVSASCNRNEAVNFADYTGVTGGFMQTGYTLQDASRLQQVTLESVTYYDTYTFASILDVSLFKSSSNSAKGLQTGSVTYSSDGKKSISAFYYDLRGNVTESRERTSFGTLRTTVNTYTYSGQPLKSTLTEGSMTTVTENSYDTATGLLTATDVTVNGTKQRVSAVSYDSLGRIASVTRGAAQKSGGTVSYKYNLHGQTTEIKGPGLTQCLFYADGPGKKLYNGSVSAMTWTMGTDTRVRGYKYTYNGYGWLTAAEYGENDDLWANQHRYTERFLNFMPNGGVRRLQRHGLKADGVHGKVDNLHISYDGNRITTVLEDADQVTLNGSMDYPGKKREMAFEYNEWGALVKDESRGITDISYDRFGNPLRISFSGGSYSENVYSASGEKLKANHATLQNGTLTGKTTMEYHGNIIYRNNKVDMVLFPGGYATVDGGVTFHYYTQDYLGNNRAVINGSTGAIEQTVAYYPYGAIIADLGTPTTGQPYKFGGKELLTANGLNEYDFGARQYYSAVPAFTRIDPMAESFPHLSPYLFCGNDPVNKIDPTGEIIETVWDIGNVIYDVGAAIYNHATGNHEAAKENWIDAAWDTGAVLIPGVAAGVSKAGKIIKAAVGNTDKVADAVSSGKKMAKEMKNADRIAEGKEFGKSSAKSITDTNKSAAAEVTLVPKNGKGNVNGNRTRTDVLKGNNDDTYHIIEYKLTDSTPLTKGQKNAWEHVKNGNGIFEVRSNVPGLNLKPGDNIKVTDYKIEYKYRTKK